MWEGDNLKFRGRVHHREETAKKGAHLQNRRGDIKFKVRTGNTCPYKRIGPGVSGKFQTSDDKNLEADPTRRMKGTERRKWSLNEKEGRTE